MTGWLIEALVASTLLMLLVLLVRAPVRQAFGAQLGYALWALPVLRLLLPPLPAAWRQVAVTPISRAGETITIFVGDAPAQAVAAAPSASLAPMIGAAIALLWAAGAIGFLVWHLTSHARHCRRLLRSAASIEEVRGVRVIASKAAAGPLAFGVMRRYVAFPLDFADRYDADERELALEHEIGHHQRGDLVANWIALAVLALHWFNPVAWRAFRAFRADQELANDARVLAGRSTIDRHAYACAIVKAAHGGAVSAACHLHTIDDLKGRIRMLSTSRLSPRRLAAGGALVSSLALVGLGLTASGTSAASALSGRVGDAMGVDLQTPAAPAAPAAPPAPAAPAAAIAPAAPAAPHRVIVKTVHDENRVVTINRTAAPVVDAGAIQPRVDRAMTGVPAVTERRCVDGADGGPQRFVITTGRGDRRAMVICSNRIQTAALAGAEAGLNAEKIRLDAMASALASVQATRAHVSDNDAIPAAERQEALADIDAALAELRAEMASGGKD